MKRLILSLALLCSATQPAHSHTHGKGELDIATDGSKLSISLELPLDAAVGFERAPRNASEKAAIASAEKTLNDPQIFTPAAAAACTRERVTITMPGPQAASDQVHADIRADYSFVCTKPAALKSISTTLFTHFKRLYRLDVQRAGSQDQSSGRMSPKKPEYSW